MQYFILFMFFCLNLMSFKALQADQDYYRSEDLFEAVLQNDLKKVKKIIKSKQVDVNVRDDSEKTPLHYASSMISDNITGSVIQERSFRLIDSSKMAEFLIKSGAQVDARDEHKNTPLHIASSAKNPNVVNFLLSQKANPNAKNTEGQMALSMLFFPFEVISEPSGSFISFDTSHKKISQALIGLLENGANPNAKDIYGNTAAHYALGISFHPEELTGELSFSSDEAKEYQTRNIKHIETLLKQSYNPLIKNKEGTSVASFLHFANINKEQFQASFVRGAKQILKLVKLAHNNSRSNRAVEKTHSLRKRVRSRGK